MPKQYTILGAKNGTIHILGHAYNQGIAFAFELSVKHLYDNTRTVEGKAKVENYSYCDGRIFKNTGVN